MSVTIRVSASLRDTLKILADQQGVAMQVVVEEAILAYQERLRLKALNQALLRLTPQEQGELQQEYGFWEEASSQDGLGPEDVEY